MSGKMAKTGENEMSPLVKTTDSSILTKQSSVVVFQPGSEYGEDYDTFRIPAILCHNGMCLAFCEGRKESKKDYGPIDIVLRRGTLREKGDIDWESKLIKVVCSTDKRRVMNPSPVVDSKTGDIVLLYIEFPVSATVASLIVKKRYEQKFCCIRSRDNGLRWESPTDITDVFKEMEDTPLVYAPGPGHAIQMQESGRMIVSGNSQYRLPSKFPRVRRLVNKIAPFYGIANKSCIVYSDDGGKAWKAGADIESAVYCCHRRRVHANESQAAQLHDGRLYVNSRTKEPRQNRQSAFSSDEGESFTAEETKLVEPSGVPRFLAAFIPNSLMCGGCEGSILTFPLPTDLHGEDGNEEILIFSNPASKFRRKNMSLRTSNDEGSNWSGPKTVYPGPSAYSDLVHLKVKGEGGPNLLGCLYECGKKSTVEHIVLDTFNIRDVVG
ncbi:Sialidase-3 [Holothuria leucospilota]|uniref:Sialidase-3 n=1 Tax=Holothuria leucospilota TaxID=206669 RepID=A0A9Q0YQ95_HOLLE|nr:Sialidase-3 [Holothuria leucospilota]